VVSFIFADLIVLPILDIYRRYYGRNRVPVQAQSVPAVAVATQARSLPDPDKPAPDRACPPRATKPLTAEAGRKDVVWVVPDKRPVCRWQATSELMDQQRCQRPGATKFQREES
jgi:hypothetical protein